MNKITILLPAYNEEKALPELIQKINELIIPGININVVIVDDGSQDNTYQAVKNCFCEYSVKILRHIKNKGLGKAIITGFKYILKEGKIGDLVVILDADDTHNPLLIQEMLKKIKHSDIVIASRYTKYSKEVGVKFERKIFSLVCNKLFKVLFPIKKVKDYTCGFRMYRLEIIKNFINIYKQLPCSEKGFTCMVEILVKFSFLDINCDEVPLILRYDKKLGKSKMKPFKTIIRYFYLINKLAKFRRKYLSNMISVNS